MTTQWLVFSATASTCTQPRDWDRGSHLKSPPFLLIPRKSVIVVARVSQLSSQQAASWSQLIVLWYYVDSTRRHRHHTIIVAFWCLNTKIFYTTHTHTHTYLCLPFFDYNIIRLLLACCCGCGCLPGIVGERPPTRLRRRMCAKSNWWWWTESETRSDKSEWSSTTSGIGQLCVRPWINS